MNSPASKPDPDPRRGARRTACAVALVAVGIYSAFLLSVMWP